MAHLKAINDLLRHNHFLDAQFKNVFDSFLSRGWYVLGSEVTAFEKEFAEYCGVNFAVGVADGTEALELALRAMQVGPGDKVALVANAGGYGTIALNSIGAIPVYVDVEIDTFNMDVQALSKAIDENDIRSIIVTHLYGRLANIDEITKIAALKNIKLIEDCAQAHGAILNGKKAGSWGDIASFSFYPTKNLGALGDGGALVCNNAETAKLVKQLRQYGWETKYCSTKPFGRNSRLDELQAAFLRVKLPYLDGWNLRRCAIAALYHQAIKHKDIKLSEYAKGCNVAHLYVVRTEYRDSLSKHLRDCGVPHDIHFPVPDHQQPMFADRFANLQLESTELLAKQVLTLPCFPEMTDDEVSWVCEIVNKWNR
ncbi:aminotransferase EvaB [Oxalobacteraceae bacterium GrIS 2.11]